MVNTRLSECGRYQVIPVNSRFEQVVPVVHTPPAPIADVSPPAKPKGFTGVALGLIVFALGLAVLSGGNGESAELVELRRENQYLRNRVSQLEHQLIGIYSAQ